MEWLAAYAVVIAINVIAYFLRAWHAHILMPPGVDQTMATAAVS